MPSPCNFSPTPPPGAGEPFPGCVSYMFFYIPVRQLTRKIKLISIPFESFEYLSYTTSHKFLCVFYIPINQLTKGLGFLVIALQLLSYTPPPWGRQTIPWLRFLNVVPHSGQATIKKCYGFLPSPLTISPTPNPQGRRAIPLLNSYVVFIRLSVNRQ